MIKDAFILGVCPPLIRMAAEDIKPIGNYVVAIVDKGRCINAFSCDTMEDVKQVKEERESGKEEGVEFVVLVQSVQRLPSHA